MSDNEASNNRDKQLLKSVINSALDAVIIIDERGIVLEWNNQATKIFGWEREEALNQQLSDMIVPEKFREAHIRGMQHFLKTGEGPVLNKRIEIDAINKEGSHFPVELTIIPNKIGDVYYFSSFVRDITDRKNTEEELRRALESEKSYNELNRKFVSMASHEFRTPLTSIHSNTQLITDFADRLSKEDIVSRVQRIYQSSIRMEKLIEDVLILGKLDTISEVVDHKKVKLSDVLKEITDELNESELKDRSLIISGLENEVPLLTDKSYYQLILRNILENAGKYSDSGSTIILDFIFNQSELLIKCKDYGIGIPIGEQDLIFEPFQRASNTEGIKGNGLGLQIVKKSVLNLGGEITVESELGKGSLFQIRLPI